MKEGRETELWVSSLSRNDVNRKRRKTASEENGGVHLHIGQIP